MSDMTDALEEMVQETLGLLRKVRGMENWGDESLWAAGLSQSLQQTQRYLLVNLRNHSGILLHR